MMKPVRKFTRIDPDGSMHQFLYCRYCNAAFESIITTEKDAAGRFRTVRKLLAVEVNEFEPQIES